MKNIEFFEKIDEFLKKINPYNEREFIKLLILKKL